MTKEQALVLDDFLEAIGAKDRRDAVHEAIERHRATVAILELSRLTKAAIEAKEYRDVASVTWGPDSETDHVTADRLLLECIGDPEVTAAFDALPKWYA